MKILPTPKSIAFSNKEVNKTDIEYIKDPLLKDEEYIITVNEGGRILVKYSTDAGDFYARQTLRQLVKKGESIPVCVIRDSPAFTYRAFMLDCARHMFSVEEIKKLIDAMALLKFNKFHWHLTDDQGWRIESEVFKKLNTVSAVRKYSDFGKTREDEPYGRVYTKAEIRDIVEYCKERFIEVIPEFDIPGHTSALLAAFPELTCNGLKVEVKTHQGIFKDVLCLAKSGSLETVLKIFDEICELFPSEYIHLGGDETPGRNWKLCPDCRKLMEQLGIESTKEYQNSFTNKVIEHLENKGKTCIVWNDAAAGKNLDKRAVVHYWKENDKATVDFANEGGKLILSPFTYYYTDYDYDITPLNRTCSFNPKLRGLNSIDSVIGLEVPIWTEYISDNDRLEEMLFPRAVAVAEAAWNGKCRDYGAFCEKLEAFSDLLNEGGIKVADKELWKRSRAAMPKGWLRFLNTNYSLEYIKSALK